MTRRRSILHRAAQACIRAKKIRLRAIGLLPSLQLLLVAMLIGLMSGSGAALQLVTDGQARAAIVLPDSTHPHLDRAAQELQMHLQKISGAMLQITRGAAPGGLVPIEIGPSFAPDLQESLVSQSDKAGAFILSVRPERVRLVGNSPEGTLYAAFELLEQLGIRWYLPGDLGTVIPESRTVTLDEQETFQAPTFQGRHYLWFSASMPWYHRQRMGGFRDPGCHGIPQLPPSEFETEPELWALIDGEHRHTQLCLTNPEVLKRAVAATIAYFDRRPDARWIGMGPEDTGGFCMCDACRRHDTGKIDPISGRRLMTDRYIWFFNQILAEVHKKHPGKKLCFYAYDSRKQPPEIYEPNQHLVPIFAPITHCRIHGMSNPVCPDRSMYRDIVRSWTAMLPETYDRGYCFNLACVGFPFSKIHMMRDEIPELYRLGVKGLSTEVMHSWAALGPTLYISCRLMWDVNADVDALLAEFYEKFFGPAAGPMGEYLTLVDHALRDTDVHSGSSFCMPRAFPPERMMRGRALLDRAARGAAGDTIYSQRVRIFRLNYDQLEAFLQMLNQRNQFDFAAAQASLDRLRAIIDEMLDFCLYPPGRPYAEAGNKLGEARLLWPKAGRSYLNRFWSPATESGYERLVERGEFVVGAPDEWDFLIDPSKAGEALRWYRDGRIGGNWQSLKTKTASWSDQGLHYYKGLAWYRTEVTVPEEFTERQLLLWFGGVDEIARVWFNGTLLGQTDTPGERLVQTAGTFKPVEFDVTGLVRFGKPNTIAVKIINDRLSEIGTGGITAPVMFWSPKNGSSE